MSGLSITGDPWGQFGAALGISADSSFDQPRTTATVPTDALQSMQPVTQGANEGGDWGDFWRDTLGGVIGYALRKDAVQSGVIQPGAQTPNPRPTGTAAGGSMLRNPLVIGGLAAAAVLAIVLVARKA